jgi:Fe-S-cluster containining protein
MTLKYFKCDPENLCDKAECCRDTSALPGLSVGDYIRLSDHTGESITQIWRTKGSLTFSTAEEIAPGRWIAHLSLLHDPCPYLLDDYRCGVHDVKPIGCGSFPLYMMLTEPAEVEESYSHYRCLRNVQPRPEQAVLAKEMFQMMCAEQELDHHMFWKGWIPNVRFTTLTSYFEFFDKAVARQKERDPKGESERTKMLEEAIKTFRQLVEDGTVSQGIQYSVYKSLLGPIVFAYAEDEVAERMDTLDQRTIAAYRKNSKEWERILKKID